MKANFPCEQINSCSKMIKNRLTGFLCCIKSVTALLMLPLLFFSMQTYGQSANIDQVRNGPSNNPQKNFYTTFNTTPTWVNGNAGSSNAHYVEGMSIGYRSLLTGLTNGNQYEYIIEYDTKHSASMAIDYLTHYQRLEPHGPFGHPAEVLDPRIFQDGSREYLIGLVSTSTFDIPAPFQAAANTPVANMPQNSFNALPAAERKMTILNGTITDISYVLQQSLSTSASSATTSVKIRFTAGDDSVVLAWGGHIASRLDWGYTNPPTNTIPRSAGGISGSPYHMRHLSMNTYPGLGNISLGNQDRSLSAAAVVPPPICGISTAQVACVATPFLSFNYTESTTGKTFLWAITGANTAGAKIDPVTGATGSTVKIVPVGTTFTAGSFDLQLTVTQNSIPVTCTMSPAGTFSTAVVGATAAPSQINLATSNTSQLNTVLTGSSDANATSYTYAWTQSPASGGSLSSATIINPVFTATAPGSYTFVVTATQIAAPNCSDTGIVVVNVSASTPPCTVAGPSPICPGSTNPYIYDPTGDGIADPIPANFTAVWTLENNTNSAGISGLTNGNTVSVVSGTSCNTAYRIKITLTSTSGLISTSCFKDVTVNDITPPTFTNCPADVVIECSGSSDAANTGTATATDNCSANVTFKDATTPGCYTLITRTWTATDPCGNTATCVQRIIKRDRTAPVITCPASGDATATDNCSATINIFFKDEGSTRTWTAVDESGNYSTCTQNTSAPRVAQTNVVQQAVAVEQTVKVDATKVPNLSSSSIKGVVKTDRLNVNAFPNPYTNEVNFRFTSPVSGKAILEVFDMTGRKLGVVYQGNINANIQKAINYKVPALNRGAMIYKFSVGNLKEHGSLLPTKQ